MGEERREKNLGGGQLGSRWLAEGLGESLDMFILMPDLTFLANEMFCDKP